MEVSEEDGLVMECFTGEELEKTEIEDGVIEEPAEVAMVLKMDSVVVQGQTR